MASESEPVRDDIEALRAALSAGRARRDEAVAQALRMEAELALARALRWDGSIAICGNSV